ncbi:hypothetical protein JCM8097_001062 [Rhodosporidiobolus ruineniae]
MAPALDHIIILVPYDVLKNVPASLSSAFIVTPGGQHADGLTENVLILLADGCYLELIAFIPGAEAGRPGHWWGAKQGGIIDFALTSSDLPSSFPPAYQEPQAGGRLRPDGKKVEWFVTFPKSEHERGSVPFFCHDRTPRDLRVPISDAAKTTHHSGATGVAALTVRVPAAVWESVLPVYRDVFGVQPASDGDSVVYETSAVVGDGKAQIRLVKSEADKVDFGELVLRVEGEEKPAPLEEQFEGRPFRIRFV